MLPDYLKTTGVEPVFGAVTDKTPLRLESDAGEGGIFSDGVEADYVSFNSGTIVTIGVAEQQGRLICGS